MDQALVGQGGEPVERLDAELSARVADLVGHVQGPAAHEHREPGEQAPLGLVEQLVAPVDRSPEGALSSWQVLPAARQDREPPLESIEDRLWAQDLDPGCSELDRSEEHTSELQSLTNLVCRLLPE